MNIAELTQYSEIAEDNLREQLIDSLLEILPAKPRRLMINFRRSGFAFCPVCEKQVELMSFTDSAELFTTDTQDIEFWRSTASCTVSTTLKAKYWCAVYRFSGASTHATHACSIRISRYIWQLVRSKL